jgi:hypothetical protein
MDIMPMTKEEMVKRLKEGCEAEPYFPGVLGNPVTFAARWGLPLSRSYMAHLAARRRKDTNGKPARTRRHKAAKA